MSSTIVVIGVIGFVAQLVDGSLGMGYGVTSTTLLLSAGLAPAVASASVHMAEVGTTLVSGAAHWRFGNVNWRAVAMLAVPGGLGAFAGAWVLSGISADAATPWVSLVLSLLGVVILVRAMVGRAVSMRAYRPRFRSLGPLGAFAGFIDAAGGGGWGPVTTSALMAASRMQPRFVIGTVSASEFLVALGASAGFLFGLGASNFAWDAIAVLLAGGMAAAPIAAWLVRHVDHRSLAAVVAGMILFTNSERALAIVGFDPDAAHALRMVIVIGTLGLTLVLLALGRAATRGSRSSQYETLMPAPLTRD